MPLIRSSRPRVLMRGVTKITHSAAGALTTDVDVSSAGISDITKAVEKLTGFTWNTSQTGNNAGIALTSPTNLRIYSSVASASSQYVSWEILEARNSVQRGSTVIPTSTSGYAQSDITITDVSSLSKAKVYNNGGYFVSTRDAYNLHPAFWLMDTTTLRCRISDANSGGINMTVFWAVEY